MFTLSPAACRPALLSALSPVASGDAEHSSPSVTERKSPLRIAVRKRNNPLCLERLGGVSPYRCFLMRESVSVSGLLPAKGRIAGFCYPQKVAHSAWLDRRSFLSQPSDPNSAGLWRA